MKSRATIILLGLTVLMSAGCLRLATAPMREKRQEKAEAEFARLAAYSPQQLAAFMDQRMNSGLALSPAQQGAVAVIDLKYATQLHATVVADGDVRGKFLALRNQEKAKESELEPVLTPAQLALYLQQRDEMRAALRDWASAQKP